MTGKQNKGKLEIYKLKNAIKKKKKKEERTRG